MKPEKVKGHDNEQQHNEKQQQQHEVEQTKSSGIIEITKDDAFHETNLNTILKKRKKNIFLYLFDLKNEFGEASKENDAEGSPSLNAFVSFGSKETNLMPAIDISCLLAKWAPLLKITKKYAEDRSNVFTNKFSCKLSALDHFKIKQKKKNKKLEMK